MCNLKLLNIKYNEVVVVCNQNLVKIFWLKIIKTIESILLIKKKKTHLNKNNYNYLELTLH